MRAHCSIVSGLIATSFALASTMQRTRRRAFVTLGLALIVYAHCGGPLEDFHPVTPNRYVTAILTENGVARARSHC